MALTSAHPSAIKSASLRRVRRHARRATGHLKRSPRSRLTTDHGGRSIGTWLISHDGRQVPQDKKAGAVGVAAMSDGPKRGREYDKVWILEEVKSHQ